jgi:predicted ATPase/class 3 adenylate cyclase
MIDSTAATVTYLFSDIEGSTRLWESEPERAARTLAWHDEITRAAVERHGGTVVKMTGDGVHAAFDDAAAALTATVDLQLALAAEDPERAPIRVRCGLHTGADQRRANDFFGQAVNRAARIMSAAHGGQVLVSRAAAERIGKRLPEGAVLRDLGWVRLRDLGSPEYVFQLVHPALRKEFPPLRSMATTPNNLTQQLNSFVGRDREITQVQELLASSRLLTLLGIGGLGKSRLSVQVAAIVLDSYRDGVWFVELASIADGTLVPQAVAAVLGVKDDSGGPVSDALARFVAGRELLIVLDNCEHVVQACAELARRLLEAGPGVRLLVSSRDGLRVVGETIYPVAPLPAPEAHAAPVETLLAVDSVRLFLDRARAVQPALRMDERTVRAAAEICRRLDGIPLAIELAAARVRAMTVEQIAARLDDRFRLLNRGDRTALPRKQTLRALIDWSHDLLDDRERMLLRRLSVFAGGCTLEAAERVCSGDGLELAEVLDLLTSLVEKSLVLLDAASGRYRMLDTVGQYAAERLQAAGELRTTRRRHIDEFIGIAESARAALATADRNERLRALDGERENLLAAFRACSGIPDGGPLAFRLMQATRFYFMQRGMPSVVLDMCMALLALPELVEPRERWRIRFGAGQACAFMGRSREAVDHLGEALQIARALGDTALLGETLQPYGSALTGEGRYREAAGLLDEAVTLARQTGHAYEILAALTVRAMVHRLVGELDAAERSYAEALAIARRQADEEASAILLINIAMTGVLRGAWGPAGRALAEVANGPLASDSVVVAQGLIEACAGRAAVAGDRTASAQLLGFAEALAERTGLRRDAADAAYLLKCIGELRGSPSFAAEEIKGRGLTLDAALAIVRASVCHAADDSERVDDQRIERR